MLWSIRFIAILAFLPSVAAAGFNDEEVAKAMREALPAAASCQWNRIPGEPPKPACSMMLGSTKLGVFYNMNYGMYNIRIDTDIMDNSFNDLMKSAFNLLAKFGLPEGAARACASHADTIWIQKGKNNVPWDLNTGTAARMEFTNNLALWCVHTGYSPHNEVEFFIEQLPTRF